MNTRREILKVLALAPLAVGVAPSLLAATTFTRIDLGKGVLPVDLEPLQPRDAPHRESGGLRCRRVTATLPPVPAATSSLTGVEVSVERVSIRGVEERDQPHLALRSRQKRLEV